MFKNIIKKIYRFIEIDYHYLLTPSPFFYKSSSVIKTNVTIFLNLLFRRKKYLPIKLFDKNFFYDSPYATKSFLTASYDLFIVLMRGKIITTNTPVIVDVGANIGQFLFAAKILFPNARVYSIEPDSNIFSLLKKNASQYSKVKLFNVALGNKKKKEHFYISNEFSEWSSLKKLEGKNYQESIVEVVRGETLFANVKHIDILKIDVEGFEYEVIQGLGTVLKRTNYLLVELSLDRTLDDIGSSKLLKFLLENNYKLYRIGRMFQAGAGESQGAVDILFKNSTFQ